MVFLGFLGFYYFILYYFENWWVFGGFGIFAASYFVVLQVDGVFGFLGFFVASYFVVLRIGGVS